MDFVWSKHTILAPQADLAQTLFAFWKLLKRELLQMAPEDDTRYCLECRFVHFLKKIVGLYIVKFIIIYVFHDVSH